MRAFLSGIIGPTVVEIIGEWPVAGILGVLLILLNVVAQFCFYYLKKWICKGASTHTHVNSLSAEIESLKKEIAKLDKKLEQIQAQTGTLEHLGKRISEVAAGQKNLDLAQDVVLESLAKELIEALARKRTGM